MKHVALSSLWSREHWDKTDLANCTIIFQAQLSPRERSTPNGQVSGASLNISCTVLLGYSLVGSRINYIPQAATTRYYIQENIWEFGTGHFLNIKFEFHLLPKAAGSNYCDVKTL
jgi:hypothetical protein